MEYCVADIEADNLLRDVTKIHCMSIERYSGRRLVAKFTLRGHQAIINFLRRGEILVGHNFCRYDVPTLEKILRIKIHNRIIDTLALSWYLYPELEIHGLADWGVRFGIAKPPIDDWQNLPIEVYEFRCSEDVRINSRLFHAQLAYLDQIYNGDSDSVDRLITYLTWKMDCAREQEEVKWKLDVDKCNENLSKLVILQEGKFNALVDIMPRQIIYKSMNPPKNPLKADGSISVVGERWYENLLKLGLPNTHDSKIKIPTDETDPGNPNSHPQMKDWLFSMGWVPDEYKYVPEEIIVNGIKTKTGKNRSIPQIGKDGKLTDSVKALIVNKPELEVLDGLYILNHRISILNGFLENVDDEGYLQAEIAGLTNTLRFKHKIIVNLPTVQKPYGEEVRGVLICDEGYTLCGSDMSSLEDNTKRHYMFKHDPEYVKEMSRPDFDPHLDIALQGELMTVEECQFYKWMDKKVEASTVSLRYTSMTEEQQKAAYKDLGKPRKDGKQVNFACVYGAGPPKIALSSGMSLELAKILHTAYWKRNWSVKAIAKECFVINIGTQMWLYNPVSRFYYSLRYDKDKFSTLNQGTGVYAFDCQVREVRNTGIKLCGQFHDEIAFPTPKGSEDSVKSILQDCITRVNTQLNLNVKLGISVDFGNSYSDIH